MEPTTPTNTPVNTPTKQPYHAEQYHKGVVKISLQELLDGMDCIPETIDIENIQRLFSDTEAK